MATGRARGCRRSVLNMFSSGFVLTARGTSVKRLRQAPFATRPMASMSWVMPSSVGEK